MSRIMVWLAAATLAAAACSSASLPAAGPSPAATVSAAESCAAVAADSIYGTQPVFRDCAVDTVARNLTPNARVNWDPRVDRSQRGVRCYSAEVQFVVGTDGRPELPTAQLVRSNDTSFGAAVMASIGTWRYEPARKDGMPVRQLVRERKMTATAVRPANSPATADAELLSRSDGMRDACDRQAATRAARPRPRRMTA